MKSRTSVHQSGKKLKKLKYVRQLNPKDYQETMTGWKSNRYQVLWDGDEALPRWEDVQSAKPLQLRSDADDEPKETGGLGDLQYKSTSKAVRLHRSNGQAVKAKHRKRLVTLLRNSVIAPIEERVNSSKERYVTNESDAT